MKFTSLSYRNLLLSAILGASSLLLSSPLAAQTSVQQCPPTEKTHMFVGESDVWWAAQTANTIHVLDVNYPQASLQTVQQLTGTISQPSWLLFNCQQNLLYTASADGAGVVSAYRVDPTSRELSLLNKGASGGDVPVYLVQDFSHKFLLLASYNSGTLSAVALNNDGSVGELSSVVNTGQEFSDELPGLDKDRQGSAHAHMVELDPEQKLVWVADLGLDRLVPYQFNADNGQFTLVKDKSFKFAHTNKQGKAVAVGPRHFAFEPQGKFMYVANELDNTVSTLSYNDGQLTELQYLSTLPGANLPADCGAPAAAQIVVDPQGKFVYVSNRLDCAAYPDVNAAYNSIAIFKIDQATGLLSKVAVQAAGVLYPRNFNIDPSGKFLYVAGQLSNDIKTFNINSDGTLTASTNPVIPVHAPTSIIFG